MGMDELQVRVDRAEANARPEKTRRLEELRQALDGARNRASTLDSIGPDEWHDHREGMEEARKLLDEALEESRRALEE